MAGQNARCESMLFKQGQWIIFLIVGDGLEWKMLLEYFRQKPENHFG